jgi:hypothetical protein
MEKKAKIEAIGAKNFKKFSNIEVVFNGNVTRFVASNGEGKTTLGSQVLLAALKGVAKTGDALIGDRWQFIGDNGKSADAWVKIRDTKANALVKFSNHITAGKNDYAFELLEGPEGYIVDEKWFRALLNASLLSADTFCSLTPKQQAIELGIDVSKHDEAIKQIKSEYTLKNRELKAFGTLNPVNKVDPVSITKLIKEKESIEVFNKTQEELKEKSNNLRTEITDISNEIDHYKKMIREKASLLLKKSKEYITIPIPKELKDISIVKGKINSADETNKAAVKYEQYKKDKEAKNAIIKSIENNRSKLAKEEEKRKETIKKFNLPFDELSIDDDGGLTLKDRHITHNTFSSGEREVIVAKLAASTNPDFKVRFVDDIDLLDDNNQDNLINTLEEMGFQLILASVRDTHTVGEENILYIRDAEIIKK